jgi:hypothetical protein
MIQIIYTRQVACIESSQVTMKLLRNHIFSALLLLSVVALCGGCGNSAKGDNGDHVLDVEEAKGLLLQLPYRYEFRHVKTPKDASGALAGRATTSHGTSLNFGVALGKHPGLVPVPKAGTTSAYGYPAGGFVFSDDLQIPGKQRHWHRPARFRTERQWNEAITIAVTMQEKLCKATTGKPCPP